MSTTQKFANFQLLDFLGQKGCTETWLASQEDLGRQVLLKILTPSTPRELERFEKEAKNLAAFEDIRIAQIYDFGRRGSQFFLSSEWVKGETFLEAATRVRNTPGENFPKWAARVAGEIAEALEHIHLHGVIHRNLRPENLLVDEGGQPRITDFSLARSWDSRSVSRHTEEGQGSLYQAPEQIVPGRTGIGHTADIFALGIILYQALTGRHPFPGEGRAQEDAILKGNPSYLRKSNSRIPADLAAIVHKALQTNPAQRYARARDLAADLKNFTCNRPVTASPPGRLGRFVHTLASHRMTAAFVLLSGIATMAGYSYYRNQAQLEENYAPQSRNTLAALRNPAIKEFFNQAITPTQLPNTLQAWNLKTDPSLQQEMSEKQIKQFELLIQGVLEQDTKDGRYAPIQEIQRLIREKKK